MSKSEPPYDDSVSGWFVLLFLVLVLLALWVTIVVASG